MAFSPATGDINETKADTRVTIKFEAGTTSTGDVHIESKTYQNIKLAATALEKYNFGQAIAYLTDRPLSQINTGDTLTLTLKG